MVKLHYRLSRETRRLAVLLGIERPHALGLIVDLWLWAADNRPLGRLTDITPDDLALYLETTLDPGDLWRAMVEAGVIWDGLADGRTAIANWLDEDLGRPHAKFFLWSSFAGHMAQHINTGRFDEACWACQGEVPVAIPIEEILKPETIAKGFPHPKKGPLGHKKGTSKKGSTKNENENENENPTSTEDEKSGRTAVDESTFDDLDPHEDSPF